MILTDDDLESYMRAFDLPDERRAVLQAVFNDANHVTANHAKWTPDDGTPSIFLRSAAHCLVMMYLSRPDKGAQRKMATAFWNLLALNGQGTPSCKLH
ncbi:hypothetical protein [uncultured Luteimonas sp.]|uniref:hypothetical protein n=1 Tax=uncultured Luteimonas sp. TaxID=453144 RepID=UPI002611FB23|nr:hypothetical protein [uncultured Luteimonas sp.]